MKQTKDFSYLLKRFLSIYLLSQRNLSPNTIASYRDTFKLYLEFNHDVNHIEIDRFCMDNFTRDNVIDYLDWLVQIRHNSYSSVNQRLAAIKSFTHYIGYEMPEFMFLCQQISAIPMKRTQCKIISYFSPEGIKIYFNMIDKTSKKGFRDYVLLILLYDSAMRVQELINIKLKDFRIGPPAILLITGKGRKKITIPITKQTSDILTQYINSLPNYKKHNADSFFFTNNQDNSLTRAGITYIIKKYEKLMIKAGNSSLIPQDLSPHCFRHSKAIHLKRAGVPLIYIRDFLGHSSIKTTEIYAKVDIEEKRKAIEEAYPLSMTTEAPDWENNKSLIKFLSDLCK